MLSVKSHQMNKGHVIESKRHTSAWLIEFTFVYQSVLGLVFQFSAVSFSL